jgi:hypothetical protein
MDISDAKRLTLVVQHQHFLTSPKNDTACKFINFLLVCSKAAAVDATYKKILSDDHTSTLWLVSNKSKTAYYALSTHENVRTFCLRESEDAHARST